MWRDEALARERARDRELAIRQHLAMRRLLADDVTFDVDSGRRSGELPMTRILPSTIPPLRTLSRVVTGVLRRIRASAPSRLEHPTG